MNILLADDGRRYELGPSAVVYECPEGVAATARQVPVDAYPPSGKGPIRVKVEHRTKLAREVPREAVKLGDRVLLSLMGRDLLALFVATVEAP